MSEFIFASSLLPDITSNSEFSVYVPADKPVAVTEV
jgi:hypothetical protein